MKKYAWLLIACFLFSNTAAFAGNAEIMMMPTRVVMDAQARYSTVQLKNIGKATGNFSVNLVDMEMTESGTIVPLAPNRTDPYSAIPYLHISPRSITLKPGESQVVRLVLRKPEALQTGEYRSHLRVKIENDNVEESENAANVEKKKGITVKTNLVIYVPVIFRHGETQFAAQIADPRLVYDKEGRVSLNLYLLREGNRSVLGDFSIIYKEAGGKSRLLQFYPGIAIYRPTNRRLVSIPIDLPKNTRLGDGTLEIRYSAQESEGGKILATKAINTIK
ncbi:MAG: hypothetical protein V4691_07705 [Pseudomonadota bacterium]